MAQNVENDLETWINFQGLKEGLVSYGTER